MSEQNTPIKFNFFDFQFSPLAKYEGKKSSHHILKECIQRINDERTKKQSAIVIDRHEGRSEEEPRSLFITSIAYITKKNRYKGKIHLLRDNKIPTLVDRTNFTLTPLELLKDSAIAETTNFLIDMNGDLPVVCCEFNNFGPRVLDIEYYFRYISSHRMLHISRACKALVHMKKPIDEVLDSMTDVLQFRIKARPQRLNYLCKEIGGAFVTNMNALAGTVKPKSLKIDAFFRDRGADNSSKNTLALAVAKRILNAIKNDNKVTEDIDDFFLSFEKEDGSDDTFNLIRGKQEIGFECPNKSNGNVNTKVMYEKLHDEFSLYLQQRFVPHESN